MPSYVCNVELSSGIWLLGFISKFKACILVGVVLVTCSAHLFYCFQNGDSIVPQAESSMLADEGEHLASFYYGSVCSHHGLPLSLLLHSKSQVIQAARRAAFEGVFVIIFVFAITLFQFLKSPVFIQISSRSSYFFLFFCIKCSK